MAGTSKPQSSVRPVV